MSDIYTIKEGIDDIEKSIEGLIDDIYSNQTLLSRRAISHAVYGLVADKVKELESMN